MSSYLPVKLAKFLKSRLVFNICCCRMFVNKPPTYISHAHISKSKRYFDVKFSRYFHMKTKVLRNFQICISVPLSNRAFFFSEYFYLKNHPKNTYLHSHFHDVREFHHCFSSCFHDYFLRLHSSTTFPYSRRFWFLLSDTLSTLKTLFT